MFPARRLSLFIGLAVIVPSGCYRQDGPPMKVGMKTDVAVDKGIDPLDKIAEPPPKPIDESTYFGLDERLAVQQIEAGGGTVKAGVVSVEFVGDSESADDLTVNTVSGFKALRSLFLVNSRVTDSGLKDLSRLEHLETLDLSGSQRISDAGLRALKEVPSLQKLIIRGCGRITPQAKAELRKHFKEVHKSELLITGP